MNAPHPPFRAVLVGVLAVLAWPLLPFTLVLLAALCARHLLRGIIRRLRGLPWRAPALPVDGRLSDEEGMVLDEIERGWDEPACDDRRQA